MEEEFKSKSKKSLSVSSCSSLLSEDEPNVEPVDIGLYRTGKKGTIVM